MFIPIHVMFIPILHVFFLFVGLCYGMFIPIHVMFIPILHVMLFLFVGLTTACASESRVIFMMFKVAP